MNQKNSFRHSNNDDPFNLDNYLDEQSRQGNNNQAKSEPRIKPAKGSFLRNSIAISLFLVVGLLYFNDWSPSLVYGNIFGQDELQAQPANTNSSLDEIRGLAELKRLEASEKLRLAELKGLENNSNIGVDAEEISTIQKEAIRSAFEGLEALESLEELENLNELSNLDELIGQSVQLGLSEALAEISKIDFGELIAFETFKVSLEEQNLLQNMTEESLKEIFEADVSSDFIKRYSSEQKQDELTASKIIEAYKNENN